MVKTTRWNEGVEVARPYSLETCKDASLPVQGHGMHTSTYVM